MGETKGAYRFLLGNLREQDHLEYIALDEKIILKCILEKLNVGTWTGSLWLRVGTYGGLL